MESVRDLDKYIKGTMSEKELDDFTKKIVQDQFEEEKLVDKWNGILDKDAALQSLKNSENKSSQDSTPPPSSAKSSKFRRIGFYLTMAASLLILVALGYLFSLSSGSVDFQQLAANELAQPYSVSSSRSGGVEGEEKLLLANDFYRQGDFASAIPLYEQHLAEVGNNNSDLFYLGLSELYLGNADEAVPHLTALSTSEDDHLKMEATWFLGLAYLKNDMPDKAKEQLVIIADKGGWKSSAAINLLNAMK